MALWRALAKPLRYAALAAGVLPALAFPQLNLEFLGWCGLVPAMLIIRVAPSPREAAVRGWWMGAGFILASLYWLVPSIGPALLLVAVVFGVLWTGFGVAAWALLRPPLRPARTLAALAVLPGYWVFTEWARSWQGFGGPWDVLGASQWQHPSVLALAAVGGVWLISFALVAANTGITILLLARGMVVRAAGAAGVAVALAAGPLAFALTAAVPPAREVTVALVQPGITSNKHQRVDASLQLSGRLAAGPSGAGQSGAGPSRAARPDLIVWGESSVGTDIVRQPKLYGQIRRLAAGTGAQVLVNQDASLPDGARSKVALLIGRHGIVGSYTKTRLVPFGEYIPLRAVLGWLAAISRAAATNMVPGDGAHLITATDRLGRPLPLGVLICFESAFPDMSRVDTDRGAQLIVYQTSDSTFQDSWAPGPARVAGRGAGCGDRPARGAGRADRGHRGLRRTRAAAGHDEHAAAGRDRDPAGTAAGGRAHPVRPAWRLRALGGDRHRRGGRYRRFPDGSAGSRGPGTVGRQPPARPIRPSSGCFTRKQPG